MGRSGCVYNTPALKGHTIFFLGQPGCVNLIPVSKAIKTTSGPVGPYLTHSGVECHPNYLQAGRTDYFSFRRQRSPRPLLGRWGSVCLILAWKATQTTFGPVGQKQKSKKKYGAFRDSNPYLFERPALHHIDCSDYNNLASISAGLLGPGNGGPSAWTVGVNVSL
jgi:hypothetical protein